MFLTLLVVLVTAKRWKRHDARMHDTIGAAMGWKSGYELMMQERAQRDALQAYDENKDHAIERQRAAHAWQIDDAPDFIDHDRHAANLAAHAEYVRRDTALLNGASPESLDDPEQDDDKPWLAMFVTDLQPLVRPRLPKLKERHSDAEQCRLEKELCRAINKHWDGAFHRLLAEGANPNGFKNSGKPLRIAVLRGKTEYMGWLLALGADPNAMPHGRTILATLMSQVSDHVDEGDGEGDDFGWPEKLEMLARWGANPHVRNRYHDPDDDSEGPNAWPFVEKWPVLYEAFMKGHQAWEQADRDAMRVLNDVRESAGLDAVADETEDLLRDVRGQAPMGRA